MEELPGVVEDLYERENADAGAIAAVAERVVDLLDRGEIRVASKGDDGWVVHEWVKKGILLYFRSRRPETQHAGPIEFHDLVPVKTDYKAAGVRAVPPAVARRGSFLSPRVVLMPGYVNIGAWVGPDTMIDTWATVGSCAQVGARVHISGGVGIGGVLEPVQAAPVIIEDDVFVGSRCIIVEGVVVGERAVLGSNVTLTGSTPIIDVTGDEPVEHRGFVPPEAVVVPGARRRVYPAGEYFLSTPLIVGWRSDATDAKLVANDVLRDFA
ncbi:MAG TPA: 2,3,4,5-tetrahydropyridine-2,6-dicarboxylate N-succinyltransferase [Actinomycetota bacterium]|nr:2,3,4,5-tetrahydropyridine-2,6-dicarboxylate N-succinyltransferase [Actinomycetota bacterium]